MKEITEALKTKKALLEKLLGAIKSAAKLLAEDKIEEFDRELQNCEQIMHNVDEIDSVLKTPAKSETAAAEIGKEIEHILSEIVEANKACKQLSEEKLKGFGRQIKSLRQKKQGLDAYNQTASKAVFIDAKK